MEFLNFKFVIDRWAHLAPVQPAFQFEISNFKFEISPSAPLSWGQH
jgi:hypothetical protein